MGRLASQSESPVVVTGNPKPMKATERDTLLRSLESRFEKNMGRHKGMAWKEILARLDSTPAAVKALAEMEACDRRYGRTFVYHNGAQSYYAARGFRGRLRA